MFSQGCKNKMKHVKTTLNPISFGVAGVKTKQMSLNRLYFTGERKMHSCFPSKVRNCSVIFV